MGSTFDGFPAVTRARSRTTARAHWCGSAPHSSLSRLYCAFILYAWRPSIVPEIWQPGRQEELLKRLEELRPETRAAWGKFTPARMLAHCADAMRAGLGELPVKPKPGPLRSWPLRKLLIYVAPWPKGAPTAPELIPEGDPDFETAKGELRSALVRFVTAGPAGKFAEHAAFGALTGKDWGALTYRHLDHHWRQFGL